jgi:hypothetical protein
MARRTIILEKTFTVFGKNRIWAGGDCAPRSQETVLMVDGLSTGTEPAQHRILRLCVHTSDDAGVFLVPHRLLELTKRLPDCNQAANKEWPPTAVVGGWGGPGATALKSGG